MQANTRSKILNHPHRISANFINFYNMNVDIINTNIKNFIIYSYSSQKIIALEKFNFKYKRRYISLKEENL